MKKSSKQTSVALESLGCKLNHAELQLLAGQLAAAGYRVVGADEKADVYVLNTCTVTHVADRKSRHLLNMARRRNPSVRVVALGCYAEREPQALSSIEGVELVLGNEQKWNLVELLGGSVAANPLSLFPNPSIDRTRAFLKIQDGCRNFCAYCVVPLVRSRVFSVPGAEVLAQIKTQEAAGFKEVVLTGTEIGAYDGEGLGLKDLIELILKETGIPRIRLSSLQPYHITSLLMAFWQYRRLCPHFHLSLQSGSDSVLKRMKRRYGVNDYKRAVELIQKNVPDAAITTDIIVGFPGETEAEFKESYDFCKKTQFARIHVFPYSPRPGTSAAIMAGQVPEKVKHERSVLMLTLAKDSAQAFRERFIGRTLEVLWEQQVNGVWSGLTGNYIKVYMKNTGDLTNTLKPVGLTKPYRDGAWGEISRTITDIISP
jgi:threonylcarbamoyladenosine tRNA methylthiotransferase MtaB